MLCLCLGHVGTLVPHPDAYFVDCSYHVNGSDFGVDCGISTSLGTSVLLLFFDCILGNNLDHTGPGGSRPSFGRRCIGIFPLVRIGPLVKIDILLATNPCGALFSLTDGGC